MQVFIHAVSLVQHELNSNVHLGDSLLIVLLNMNDFLVHNRAVTCAIIDDEVHHVEL